MLAGCGERVSLTSSTIDPSASSDRRDGSTEAPPNRRPLKRDCVRRAPILMVQTCCLLWTIVFRCRLNWMIPRIRGPSISTVHCESCCRTIPSSPSESCIRIFRRSVRPIVGAIHESSLWRPTCGDAPILTLWGTSPRRKCNRVNCQSREPGGAEIIEIAQGESVTFRNTVSANRAKWVASSGQVCQHPTPVSDFPCPRSFNRSPTPTIRVHGFGRAAFPPLPSPSN